MKKKIIFIAIFVFIILAFFLVLNLTKKEQFSIGFYSLSENEVKILKVKIEDLFPEDEKINFIILDDAKSLKSQLSNSKEKIDILFATDGLALQESSDLLEKLNSDLLSSLPTSLKNTFKETNEFTRYPVSIETLEFAIKKDVVSNKLNQIYTLDSMTEVMAYSSDFIKFPVSLAASDNQTLFLFLSSMLALTGNGVDESYEKLKTEINLKENCPTSLKLVLDNLVELKKQGLLHPEWFRLTEKDVRTFMEFNSCAISFMKTSTHNHTSAEVLSDFDYLQVPLPYEIDKKHIPTRIICISKLAKEGISDKLQLKRDTVFDFCLTAEGQTKLCDALELSPANSQSKCSNPHNSLGRYWVASAYIAKPTIEKILYNNTEDMQLFADEVIKYISVEGLGY